MPLEQKPFGRFDFDLAAAVTSQLIAAFDALSIGPLTVNYLAQIDQEQGVYQLYLGQTLMYVGKAEDSLPKRLGEHRWNLSGRHNIDLSLLGFKGLIIHRNWAASAHEDILIRHYRTQGSCEWNLTGIGNHDPGRNREDTVTPEEHFDAMYPINEDYVPEGIEAKEYNVRAFLADLKDRLPYIFRYECDKHYKTGSAKYNHLSVVVPTIGMTTRQLLSLLINTLPNSWQATFFPGRVILYEEDRQYLHATNVIRRS